LFSLVVKGGEATIWSGSAQASSMVLWIAGPPLLLWLAWLATRPARRADVAPDTAPERLLSDAPVSLYDRERPREERVDRN
jgi:threonine/homoserine/homoserine lactone efflux protein